MEPPKKEVRIQILAPPSESLDLPVKEEKRLSVFYFLLLLLSYVFSGVGLYFSIVSVMS